MQHKGYDDKMIYYLTFGSILGLSAGMSPGPLFALVISETIAHDIRAGIKVALVPTMKFLGLSLCVLAVFLFKDGLSLLKIM